MYFCYLEVLHFFCFGNFDIAIITNSRVDFVVHVYRYAGTLGLARSKLRKKTTVNGVIINLVVNGFIVA